MALPKGQKMEAVQYLLYGLIRCIWRGHLALSPHAVGKELMVFDEPTSGLDYARMQEVACCARELADEGRVVLVVTHDREFLQCACDRVLEL